MAEKLPKFLDPSRCVDRQSSLAGIMPASELSRLGDLYRVDDDVAAELGFDRDGYGRVTISGKIAVLLRATCQRCLKPLTVALEQHVKVVVVDTSDSSHLADNDDADTVEYSERLNLYEFIEDEILLGCPIVPQHDVGACESPGAEAGVAASSTQDDQVNSDRVKPFADLAALIKGDGADK